MSADPLVYYGDDLGASWCATNNSARLAVVQFQSRRDAEHPFRLGGWVLRVPTEHPPSDWPEVPLQAANEREAIAEARAWLDRR